MKVLIVDDSRTMRMLLKRMMNEIGAAEVVEAGHGQEALERCEEGAPTVALVDWNMPVMNGLEFVTAVRERREWDQVKLMMVTSESSPRQIYEALKAGADEYAMKPVQRDMIEDKLTSMGVEVDAA